MGFGHRFNSILPIMLHYCKSVYCFSAWVRAAHTRVLSTLLLCYCPFIYVDPVLLSDKKISHKQQLCHPRISKHLNFERLFMKSCLNGSIIPLYNIYNIEYLQFSLIVPRQSFSEKRTEKNENCVCFVAILASKDQIFSSTISHRLPLPTNLPPVPTTYCIANMRKH